jgi:hypothetical protein
MAGWVDAVEKGAFRASILWGLGFAVNLVRDDQPVLGVDRRLHVLAHPEPRAAGRHRAAVGVGRRIPVTGAEVSPIRIILPTY